MHAVQDSFGRGRMTKAFPKEGFVPAFVFFVFSGFVTGLTP